ncbi:MAG: hypothetical protein H0V33_05220 [Acidimicrobiia bacterium]|nr:hypothetical protein [Acidimicrobiia bacterium]
MSISERDRHDLYLAVEGLIGTDQADTMMSMLPPFGWADVATKHDLAALEDRLGLRFDALDLRFAAVDQRFDGLVTKAEFHREMRDQSQKMLLALVGSQISLTAVLLTAVGLMS